MIHYEVAGDGLPIVLLHGIGSNSKSWWRQLEAFSEKFKVVAWDAPGFGLSDDITADKPSIHDYCESLRELLDSLGIDSAILLGHSLGGIIAQEFYRENPQRVRSLILADSTQGGGAEAPEVRNSKLNNRIRMIRTMSPDQLARERAPKLLSPDALRELVIEATLIMSEVRPSGYEFAAKAMSTADTRGILNDIKVPLLMIWGAEDKVAPVWRGLPEGTKVKIIPHAGHLCFAEQSDAFNSIVLEFLNA